jgi:formamidopyrimidine-DNA glycosylase
MPELPEVEHVVQTLRHVAVGRTIMRASVVRSKLIRGMSARMFCAAIERRDILDVRRRGKFILIDLAGDHTLLVHLRMTGSFVYTTDGCGLPSNTRVVFHLSEGRTLGYADTRNLGIIKLVPTQRADRLKELRLLGPEPLGPQFGLETFRASLKSSRRPIKEFLLDQKRLVGLGNIYAAEVLFRARINPRRAAASVAASERRARDLYDNIIGTLSEAIACQRCGPPLHMEFIGLEYPGQRQTRSDIVFRVYDREDEPCFRCGHAIKRIRQGGRSTYYCPKCQKQ